MGTQNQVDDLTAERVKSEFVANINDNQYKPRITGPTRQRGGMRYVHG